VAAEAQRSAQRSVDSKALSPKESLPHSCYKGHKKIPLKGEKKQTNKPANPIILQPLNSFLIPKTCLNSLINIKVDSVLLPLLTTP